MSLYIVDIHGDIEGDYEIVRKYEEPKADYENRLTTDMATINQLSNSVKVLQKANSEIAGAYDKLKSDYENRLQADLAAMLEELKEQLREMHEDFFETEHFDEAYGVSNSMDIIQEKINSLKGEIC